MLITHNLRVLQLLIALLKLSLTLILLIISAQRAESLIAIVVKDLLTILSNANNAVQISICLQVELAAVRVM